ncbi:MAG TPA: hypothetical protein VIF62_25925 [Labilithrix sp.]|jgi:hypothetical protein
MKHRVPAQWRKAQIMTTDAFDPKSRPSSDEEEDTQPMIDELEYRETAVIPKKVQTVTVRIRRD